MMDANAATRSRRALIGHLDEARHALRVQHPSDESVHDARKAIKKARAALRLLREIFGEASYRRENAALRDAGRRLSPLRDAKSMADLFRAFRERHAAQLRRMDAAALSKQLDETLRAQRRQLWREPTALGSCRKILAACQARMAKRHPGASQPPVPGGLRRIYRRGRKTLATARRAGTPQALHEWRKQVKYLANALRILDASRSNRGAELVKRAEKLADRLGEEHDLAEFERHVTAIARSDVDAPTRESLSALIGRRRAKLQKRAYALGARIYARKPARFAPVVQKKPD